MKHGVILRAAPFAAALLLAGCGGGAPKSAGTTAPPPAKAAATPKRWEGREDVAKAITLLDKGQAKPARKLLAKVLKRQPDDALAGRLVKEIDTDPTTLLGAENFAYVSRPKESFAMIAQRFLGDPQLFYALARYNGVDVPSSLQPGMKLRIPGREKRDLPPPPPPTPAPRPQPAPRPSVEAPPAPRPAPVVAAPVPPKPAAPATDPRKAAQLRAAGLVQLNRGAIARAVILLQQASRLDPSNPLIRKDLDRATRIQHTVQNGH